MGKDYYKILEVKKDATQDEIKKSYRNLVIVWSPDNPKEKFLEISEAYEVLRDPIKRKVYDQFRDAVKRKEYDQFSSSDLLHFLFIVCPYKGLMVVLSLTALRDIYTYMY